MKAFLIFFVLVGFRCADDDAWEHWHWKTEHGSMIDYSGNYYDQYYVALVGGFRFLSFFGFCVIDFTAEWWHLSI